MYGEQKISTCLWFDGNAEEAASFYVSLFPSGRITDVMRYGEGMPMPAGTVLTITFEIEGREFIALNGGPQYKFTEANSLFVKCETQAEVDRLWDRLSADGGAPIHCGWIKDKFGLTWQIVPTKLGAMLKDKDPVRAQRVTSAMLQMVKLDIVELQRVYDGKM
jgi:predicted 3-demethylubiquinone-9 3-methyltransferase (glyoxalase superfamily)